MAVSTPAASASGTPPHDGDAPPPNSPFNREKTLFHPLIPLSPKEYFHKLLFFRNRIDTEPALE